MKNNYLVTIVGPTAIGKTTLSLAIAQSLQCEIISCDSRQFFKEMTIGTAVPSREEREAIKHHFIHNKSIFDSYTVGDFEREALETLDNLFASNDFVVMVGGSGLYVDAVLNGFDDFPDIPIRVRNQIIEDYHEKGLQFLQEELQKRDPVHYNTVAKQNPQRLMRALEVCVGTGKPYSYFLNKKNTNRNFIPIKIGLEADRAIIYDRINKRVDQMIENGLEKEVRALHAFSNLNALQTVGYREFFDYFENKTSLEFAIEEIKKNTRRFSKRQLTWFKKDFNTMWFDYTTNKTSVLHFLDIFIKQLG